MPQHEVKIAVDSREAALIELVNKLYPSGSANITTNEALPVGDIRFVVDGQTVLLIERKAAADLYSSLCDTRFREQRARLIQARKENPQLNLMYIFEGDVRKLRYRPDSRIKPQYLEQIQRELPYKYKIHTTFVQDVVETMRYIGHIETCFAKYGSPESVLGEVSAADGNQVGAKRAITPREFMRSALTHISGVSSKKAQAVVDKHHDLPTLFATYKRLNTEKERERLLEDLKVFGSDKRFGQALSKRVYQHLFGIAVESQPDAAPQLAKKKRTKPLGQSVIMKRGRKMGYGSKVSYRGSQGVAFIDITGNDDDDDDFVVPDDVCE